MSLAASSGSQPPKNGSPASMQRIWQRLFRTRAEDKLPHHIEHKRVYILPTRRGWAFLAALLLMLIASVNYALSLGYALCFLLTGLFAATLLHTYRNLAGITVHKAIAATAFAGENLPFSVTLINQLTMPRQGLTIHTGNSSTTGICVDAASHIDVTINTPTVSRGPQALGRITLQSDWPLGLWTTWSYLHADVSGLVFPTPETNPPTLPRQASDGNGSDQRSGLQGDVSGLRNYQVGDPIGSIAWKAAARGLGLRVRTFDEVVGIAQHEFSLSSTGLPDIEQQLSRLTAWVLQAEAEAADYALQLPDKQLASSRGPAHQQDALSVLAMFGKAA